MIDYYETIEWTKVPIGFGKKKTQMGYLEQYSILSIILSKK